VCGTRDALLYETGVLDLDEADGPMYSGLCMVPWPESDDGDRL
jgi:hypothetical protein